MKPLLLLSIVLLFGAGCGRSEQPQASTDRRPPDWLIPREGIAIVTEANVEGGPRVFVTDADTGRALTTELPAIFTDCQGVYTTAKPDEKVLVQLSVGGEIEKDRKLFGEQMGLERFEDGAVGDWNVTAAYQSTNRRWVIRAVHDDPFQKEGIYHVIECLGEKESDNLFWDGCRTIIEKATIDQSRANPSS